MSQPESRAYVFMGSLDGLDWISRYASESHPISDGAIVFWSDADPDAIHAAFTESGLKGGLVAVDLRQGASYRGDGSLTRIMRTLAEAV